MEVNKLNRQIFLTAQQPVLGCRQPGIAVGLQLAMRQRNATMRCDARGVSEQANLFCLSIRYFIWVFYWLILF